MKNLFYPTVVRAGLLLLSLLAFTPALAQDLKKEILVYILPDSLELPAGEKNKVGLQRATVRSASLTRALRQSKAVSIGKAFPTWEAKEVVTREDGEKIQAPPFHRIFKLTFSTEAEANAAITILQKLPAVLYAEKNSTPVLDNDPDYLNGRQWYLNNNGANGGVVGADINAEGAWAIFTGAANTTIAIIDTGVEITHDELTGKSTGETPVGNPHGTRVAGIAAARAMNATGIRGVNWNAQILSKRVFDAGGFIGDAAAAQKITDAVNEGAAVLNCSWSSPTFSNTLAIAFAYAYKSNRVSVATMGNTGIAEVRYPGAFTNVVTVGASLNNDQHAGYSTTGAHIDVTAPGGDGSGWLTDTYSTIPGNTYGWDGGTSFAAPQVTGLASLLKGFRTNLSNDDIAQIIRLTAEDRGAFGFDNDFGFGRIDAGQALNVLQTPNQLHQWTAHGGTDVGATGNTLYQFYSAGSLAAGNYIVRRHEVRRAVTFPQSFCQVVGAWGRGVGTTGWNMGNPNYGEGFCEIVPGTLTNTGATLRTFVYEIFNTLGQSLGFRPTTPANVTFAYSVLGVATPSVSITGTNFVCNSQTYIAQNIPNGASITWTHSPNLTYVSGQGTPNYTVGPNGSGAGWVRATITIGCATFTTPQYAVTVGEATITGYVNGDTYICPHSVYQWSFSQTGGTPIVEYLWYSPWPPYMVQSTSNSAVFYTDEWVDLQTIEVFWRTECSGGSFLGPVYFTTLPHPGCSQFRYSVSPNPASGFIEVRENAGERTSPAAIAPANDENILELRLYDNTQSLVRSVQYQSPETRIPVDGLKPGYYILHVVKKDGVIDRRHVAVQH